MATSSPLSELGPTPPRPFIAFQPPPGKALDQYDSTRRPQAQAIVANVPQTFVDAMIVREQVFVREQHIPLKNEFDEDDPLSCHWVVYESEYTQEDAVLDKDNDAIFLNDEDHANATPIGTIRLVPFPHPVHPKAGREYIDGKLLPPRRGSDESDTKQDPDGPQGQAPNGYKDRATSLHNGTEPYIKLGRLAVVKSHRGKLLAGHLINTALDWMMTHFDYFDITTGPASSHVKFNGLVCVHAQIGAMKLWERHGFVQDELMGKWYEEGIPHVGMFRRIEKHQDEVRNEGRNTG